MENQISENYALSLHLILWTFTYMYHGLTPDVNSAPQSTPSSPGGMEKTVGGVKVKKYVD